MTKKIRIKKNKIFENSNKKNKDKVIKELNNALNETFEDYLQRLISHAAKEKNLSKFINKDKLLSSMNKNQQRHIKVLESYREEIYVMKKYFLNSLLGCKLVSEAINNFAKSDINKKLNKEDVVRSISELENNKDLNKSIEISKKFDFKKNFSKEENDEKALKNALQKVKSSLCKDFYIQSKALEDFYKNLKPIINNKIETKEDKVINKVKSLQEDIKSTYETLSSFKEYFDELNNFKF